mgnify:CR=1 FL=1
MTASIRANHKKRPKSRRPRAEAKPEPKPARSGRKAAPKKPAAPRHARAVPPAPPAPPSQPPAPAPTPPARPQVSPEERFRMIQEAAYLIAEQDGFRHHPDHYWFAAERQIAERLQSGG